MNYFKIEKKLPKNLEILNVITKWKYITVFGIPILATEKCSDREVLHAANVLAQFLDNDRDGIVDNNLVLENLLNLRRIDFEGVRKALLLMTYDQDEMDGLFKKYIDFEEEEQQETNEFTMDDVREKNYVVRNNKVYDITNLKSWFQKGHRGGNVYSRLLGNDIENVWPSSHGNSMAS